MTNTREKEKKGNKDLTEIYFCQKHIISNNLEPYTFAKLLGKF